jgi:hypothetical protein
MIDYAGVSTNRQTLALVWTPKIIATRTPAASLEGI